MDRLRHRPARRPNKGFEHGTCKAPIKIYSGARAGSTPALNALATVMLVLTLVAVALAAVVMRRLRHRTPDDPNATAGIVGIAL